MVLTDVLSVVCPFSRIMTYREHGAWVVKAHLQKETDGHIISVRYFLYFNFQLINTLECCHVSSAKVWSEDYCIEYIETSPQDLFDLCC